MGLKSYARCISSSATSMLKSDQNGIEILETINCLLDLLELKSDQNGIEIIPPWLQSQGGVC